MIERLLILGGSGDLTGRYLMPALARLYEAGRLPAAVQVIGAGRDEWDDDDFRQFVRDRLERHSPGLSADLLDAVCGLLHWHRADVTEPAELRRLIGDGDDPVVVYCALPPSVYAATIDGLCETGLPAGSRLVFEKPFGTDLAGARDLNQRIRRLLPEEAVFRVDHFLALQTVQNVLGLRFGNRIFESLWNHAHVERVEITWNETLGLEGRAGYYDHTGALRDMLQNHLLQLLALVAMEPPIGLTERDLRDRKVDVLRATHTADPERTSVRARYTAGTVDDEPVPNYTDEPDVDPARETETYAQIELTVDNWRWAGVPFVLRSGKAFGRERKEIAVHFRPVPHSGYGSADRVAPNVLRFGIEPDRISLGVNLNQVDDPFTLGPAELDADLAPPDLPTYARLLQDILDGDATLSIRDDEAEEAWRIVTPILDCWRAGKVALGSYPAGSDGPENNR